MNRDFIVVSPNEKMASDITFIWTTEGWLYVTGIMDLYSQKIVEWTCGDRMTKELVLDALHATWNRAVHSNGTMIHFNRGSQYCSLIYQDRLRDLSFIYIMSRKGDCWDNAPMEAFWGKMKCK